MVTPEPGYCYLLSADSCLACPPADDAPKEAGMADAAAVAGPAAPIPTAATSAAASVLDEVLAANKAYLSSGQHTPDMPLGVTRRLAVVTCMDSRCGQADRAGRRPSAGRRRRQGGGRWPRLPQTQRSQCAVPKLFLRKASSRLAACCKLELGGAGAGLSLRSTCILPTATWARILQAAARALLRAEAGRGRSDPQRWGPCD